MEGSYTRIQDFEQREAPPLRSAEYPKVSFKTLSFSKVDETAAMEMKIQWGDAQAQITHHILNLKDQAVRKILIDMGWTPPPDKADAGIHSQEESSVRAADAIREINEKRWASRSASGA